METPDHLVIKCAALTKVFRDFWLRNRVRAVDGIDLEVARGKVFGLLGPNGSGKSTTIKMILGLLHPTSGRVAVFGKRPDDTRTKQLIGYLPEESYLYQFLSARETLDYYGRLFHLSRPQRQRRIDMLLEMVGLEQVARRPVGEYSKGMQRRIGLAQALINDPQLLVLDEPTSGLDPIGTRQIKDLILELARRGKTILLCSHLLGDVEDVCDELAIMFGGKIRARGTVDELLVRNGLTTIQAPELDVQTIQEIEALLAKRGRHIEKVERPRQKLENLFLEIVHQAQAEGLATSGARAGGAIAGFLVEGEDRGAHLPESVQAAQVIDQLVAKPSTTPRTPVTPTVTPAPPPAAELHEQVLTDLTQAKPEPPPPTPAEAAPTTKEDLSVIEGLVNKPAQPVPHHPSVDDYVTDGWEWNSRRVATRPVAADSPPEAPVDVPPQTSANNAPETPLATPLSTPPPPQPTPAPVASAPAPKTPDGEQPYEGFIDALLKVKPYVPAEEDKSRSDQPIPRSQPPTNPEK